MNIKLDSELDLRDIPGLRWSRDADGTIIAKTIRKKARRDHLYFHGPGKIGIYYERDTKMATRHARKKYLHGREAVWEMPGDLDGVLVYRARTRGDIPRAFLKKRGRSQVLAPNSNV